MKTLIKKTVLVLISAIIFSGVLSGCHNLHQEKIQSALDASVRTLEKLDCPDKTDLTEDCFNDGQSPSLVRVKQWIFTEKRNELNENHRNNLLILKSEINHIQQEFSDACESLSLSIKEINSQLKSIGENAPPLSAGERETLDFYAEQIKEVNSVLRSSIGNIYLNLKKLRNNYTEENLAQIKQTHAAAQSEIAIRLDCAKRLNQIADEIKSFLANRADFNE